MAWWDEASLKMGKISGVEGHDGCGWKEKRPGRGDRPGRERGGCEPLIIWSLLALRLRLGRER